RHVAGYGTARELAARYGVTRTTIRLWAQNGLLERSSCGEGASLVLSHSRKNHYYQGLRRSPRQAAADPARTPLPLGSTGSSLMSTSKCAPARGSRGGDGSGAPSNRSS